MGQWPFQVDLASTGMKCTWLDVASAAASAIMQLSGSGSVSHSALSPCLALLECLSSSHPLKVLAALQRMSLLTPTECASRVLSGEAQLKAAIPLSGLSDFKAEPGECEHHLSHHLPPLANCASC